MIIRICKMINIFNQNDKQLLHCFIFYFAVAICGYAALMVSHNLYNDDYCRYLINTNVGTFSSARYLTFLIESISYLSRVITDTAPFSQILSCGFLSYTAVLCLQIFQVDLTDKLKILCFVPIVVNPYLLEVFMFRFDTPFITLALLIVTISAYLSSFNKKYFLRIQTLLLFVSLFIYQSALSAYLIILTYQLLSLMRDGNTIQKSCYTMRYWFYTLIIAGCCYIPFTFMISAYLDISKGNTLLFPFTNLDLIANCIYHYFHNLFIDWSDCAIGQISFAFFATFAIYLLIQTLNNTKSIITTVCSAIGIFIFAISPLGICILIKTIASTDGSMIIPRLLYCIGIVISLVCYEICKLFHFVQGVFYMFMSIISIWNIIFLNSASNIINYFRQIQQLVFYDASKDMHDIIAENKSISHVCVIGSIKTEATTRFMDLYPMLHRIIPEKWSIAYFCYLALLNSDFYNKIIKYTPIDKELNESQYKTKIKVKNTTNYDIYVLDNKLLLVDFRNPIKYNLKPICAQIRKADD